MSKQTTTQYGDLSVKELTALVEERELTEAVKPTGSGNRVVKGDLVKTLQAADQPAKKPTPKKDAKVIQIDIPRRRAEAKKWTGVGFHPQSKRFQAQGGGGVYIGLFEDAGTAARAYDEVARAIGNLKTLNFPEEQMSVLDPDRLQAVVAKIEAKRSEVKAAADTPKADAKGDV